MRGVPTFLALLALAIAAYVGWVAFISAFIWVATHLPLWAQL